jgi:hypothetical protein
MARRPIRSRCGPACCSAQTGGPAAIEFVDNAGLPPKFLQGARERLEKARIEPRQVQGAAVSFRTGVRMDFEVAPAPQGGTVRLLGLAMLPLPIKRLYADRPANVAQVEGWTGVLTATAAWARMAAASG